MPSLRIAFVNAQPVPLVPKEFKKLPMGGSEFALFSIVEALTKLGHDLTIIGTLEAGKATDKYQFSCGSSIYSYKLVSMDEYPEIVKSKYYDVVVYFRHTHPVAIGRIPCGTSVYITHDMPSDLEALYGCIWGIDKVMFISNYQKNQYLKHADRILDFNHLCYVTRNGIDYDFIRKSINSPSRTNFTKNCFLYTSRLERGVATAIDVLDNFNAKFPADPFYSLGITTYQFTSSSNKHHPQVLALHNHLLTLKDKVPNIHYNSDGFAPFDLYQHINRSLGVIYPTTFPEVFCISSLETLACESPFICSSSGALPEVLPKGYPGLITESVTSPKFGEAFLETMHQAVVNRQKFIEIGKDHASDPKWSWDNIASEWEQLFIELLVNNNCIVNSPITLTNGSSFTLPEIKGVIERSKPTLGLAMIVKNEENNIRGCLDSVIQHVDKVSILDTGSDDRTEEIATTFLKEKNIPFVYKKKVYQDLENEVASDPTPRFAFDDARNESCKGLDTDWILWMDADERFVPVYPRPIKDFLASNYFNGYGIKQMNFSCDTDNMDEGTQIPVRIFRNCEIKIPLIDNPIKLCTFIGLIHEHIEFGPNIPVTPVSQMANFALAHFGYLGEKARREKSIKRNLKLLFRDREIYPFRVMGVALVIRDLFHMFNWELEKGKFNKDYLRRIHEIYKKVFIDQENHEGHLAAYRESTNYYQKVLQICKQNNLRFEGMGDIVCVHHAFLVDDKELNVRADKQWIASIPEFKRITDKYVKEATESISKAINPYD